MAPAMSAQVANVEHAGDGDVLLGEAQFFAELEATLERGAPILRKILQSNETQSTGIRELMATQVK